jgi:two-component system cell cycle sensor histidine kinase/response regulator CckA
VIARERQRVRVPFRPLEPPKESSLARHAHVEVPHREAQGQASILNALSSSIALIDGPGVIVSVNEAWHRFARANGMQDPRHGIGLNYVESCAAAVGPDAREARQVAFGIRSVLSGAAEIFSVEYACHSPAEQRWFLLTVTPVDGGVSRGAVVMHSDVTALRRSEAALEELSQKTARRERMLGNALASMSDFAQVYDRDGRLLFVNQPLLDLWGLTLEAVLGKDYFDLGFPGPLADRLRRQVQTVFASKQSVKDETAYTSPAGQTGHYEYIFSPVFAADGAVDFVVGSTRDVTERMRTDEARREGEERFRFRHDLAEATRTEADPGQIMAVTSRMLGQHLHASRCAYADVEPDGERFVILHDYTDGCPSTVGRYDLSLFGARAVATLQGGRTLVIRDVAAELRPDEGAAMFNAIGIQAIITCPLVKDGVLRAMMAVHQATPRDWTPGEIAIVQEVVERCWASIQRRTAEEKLLTVRNDAERRLLETAEEYRLLFQRNPHPMWVFDLETLAFLAVNEAAVQLYGFSTEEFLGMTIKDIRPPEEVPALLEHVVQMRGSSSLLAIHSKHRKKDGSLLEVEGVSNTIVFRGRRAGLVLATDVSEKRLLEAQLRQSQKMDAVGRLAGGVAHDFNNALGVILGHTELLMPKVAEAHQGRLQQILKATTRAAGLTRQLLAFSRKQIVNPQVLDLNARLLDLETMLGRLIGESVELVLVAGRDLGQVKADLGQLEQVVVNLCVNSRDAMPEGGRLRIETANVDFDAGQLGEHYRLDPGRYVMLSVSDTGCGIAKDVQSRIFEPFFTTKEEGKGTGLGLSMVYGMVKQAGGQIWLYSEPGHGTTFKIYLPRIDEPVTPEARATPMPSRGWETVLLVEDESSLREIARELLEQHGYRVIVAACGQEAIEVARGYHGPIHLLLTDVVMPRMNGRVLAETLVAGRPEMNVLYMSGYTDDVIARSGVLEAGILLIEKPFTAVMLLGRVRSALEAEVTH